MLTRCVAILLVTAAAAEAQPACSAGPSRNIGTSGSTTLKLRPDHVAFSIGVETEAASVSQAMAANSSKLAAVLAALQAKGVGPQEVQTSQFSIETPRDGNKKGTSGLQVSNQVSVTRKDPSDAGVLLQAAVDAGANHAGAFRLFVADSRQHRDRGLELAFEDAKAKASQLAALSGGTLGRVLCVAEGGYSTSGFAGTTEAITVSAEPLPTEAGTEEISFNIYVVFELT